MKEEKKSPPEPLKEEKKTHRGRPHKIDFGDPEVLKQVEDLAKIGHTEEDVAHYFGVNPSTLYRNKCKLKKLRIAIKKGKSKAKRSVASALYKKALEGNVVAQIFFLKNMDPDNWSDLKKVEHLEIREYEKVLNEVAEFINLELTPEKREHLAKILDKKNVEGYHR